MAIGEFHKVPMPWPDTDGRPTDDEYKAAAAAIGLTLADADAPDDDEKARITAEISIATARVQEYAPSAPLAIRQEAAARFHGYLKEAPSGAVTKMDASASSVQLNRTFQYSHAAAFRNCGAAALLAPWRVRRAGVVKSGDDD